MRLFKYIVLIIVAITFSGCVTQFLPEVEETRELLVVEGLFTDKSPNYVKISKSFPLGEKSSSNQVSGCSVWISGDGGQYIRFDEIAPGTYKTDIPGVVGSRYTLHVNTNGRFGGYTFQSFPVELKPVPQIDTIYYEKIPVSPTGPFNIIPDFCQIYLDTHDPSNTSRFFRWDFTETWEFRLPFDKVINPVCWITEPSREINVKSTAGLSEAVVTRYPLHYITNESDRLREKYSIFVNQYSLSEEEFYYWEKLKAVTQQVGSLYDITPASIPNNIYCVENPAEKVLGYFSVSAISSKRIFIDDYFRETPNFYSDCVHDTIFGNNPVIPNLNMSVWVLDYNYGPGANPAFTAVTYTQGCADCTVRGSKTKPYFWR